MKLDAKELAALALPGGIIILIGYLMFKNRGGNTGGSLLGGKGNAISENEAIQYAQAAGFSGDSLSIVIGIAHAESSLKVNIIADNMADGTVKVRYQGDPKPDGVSSSDRGILQINDRWHPEVSDTQAFDPASAFIAGYAISKQGTDFTPWSTYKSGAYARYAPAVDDSEVS